MQVTVVAPSQRLAPFVRRFTVVETREEATRSLLPEHGLVLGLRFGGSASLVCGDTATRVSDASLTGIVGEARVMRTSAGGGVVLAAFRETGAARFFAEPLHELFGKTLALDQVVPRAALARVRQRVMEASDNAQRIALLEQFLIARLLPDDPDSIVEAAVRAIRRARGSLRIAALARELGISQDPLEKRFRRAVGTSPKQLATLVRLQRVIDEVKRPGMGAVTAAPAGWRSSDGRSIDEGERRRPPVGRGTSPVAWSRLAIEAGYFDQSHFNREFRAVTGAAPQQFFKTGAYC
jgi:AraC-like DNA-binding protein